MGRVQAGQIGPMDPASANEQANRLRGSARGHKRAEAWHRRRAKEESQELARLEGVCQRFGIELVFEEEAAPDPAMTCAPPRGTRHSHDHQPTTQAQGGHSEPSTHPQQSAGQAVPG
jgi:hypothetical protein